MNESWVLSDAFSASVEIMLKWFLFFLLLMWSVTVTDWYMLNHPCDPEMNPASSRCMIFFFFIAFYFFLLVVLKYILFYWSIIDLQCFRCTAGWFSYTHILFLKLFSINMLLQDTDYSSLCYTILCCLLHICFFKLEI